MKIIHLVLGKANPLRMNGVNKLVYEMATVQTELGYEVELWGITKNPIHNYPKRNFKTILFPSIINKTKIHDSIKLAVENIKESTIFHFHGSFIPEFYTISRLLAKRSIPYIYTPHGALAPAALERRNWKKKWYFEFFEKKLILGAQTVVATGKSVFENLDFLVGPISKKLIPNGQPKLDFSTYRFKKDQPLVFSFCGRIALEHKGLDLLLKGFRKFLDKGEIAQLWLIGDGDELPKLKKIANDLQLKKHVKFWGAKYGDEKFSLLSESNVFVHTSRMEGFPASVLEAAALGLPCLVSKQTNVDNYIMQYDCGWVVENNTPDEIANSMAKASQLLKQQGLKSLSDNAKKMIESEFDWKVICEKLMHVYEGGEILIV